MEGGQEAGIKESQGEGGINNYTLVVDSLYTLDTSRFIIMVIVVSFQEVVQNNVSAVIN